MKRFKPCVLLLIVCWFPSGLLAQVSEAELWQGLKTGEYVGLLRHALAPGTGDPNNFQLRDCSTQRNVSSQGREQAKRIGHRFKENGIVLAKLYSSQWCRCLETAKHLDLGPWRELPALNSFFQQFAKGPQQTTELRQWLNLQPMEAEQPIVLVTHQVNITRLTDVFPRSGELVVIQHPASLAADAEVVVIGTLETD